MHIIILTAYNAATFYTFFTNLTACDMRLEDSNDITLG